MLLAPYWLIKVRLVDIVVHPIISFCIANIIMKKYFIVFRNLI